MKNKKKGANNLKKTIKHFVSRSGNPQKQNM
jgi:hypothetical protein